MASLSSSPTASPTAPYLSAFGRGRVRYPPTEHLFESEGATAYRRAVEIRGEEDTDSKSAVLSTDSPMEYEAVLAALDVEDDDGIPGGPEPAVFISNAEYMLQHERECGEMTALHHEDSETQAFFDGERANTLLRSPTSILLVNTHHQVDRRRIFVLDGGDDAPCSDSGVHVDCAEEDDGDDGEEEEHTCEQLQQLFTTIDLMTSGDGKENTGEYMNADVGATKGHGPGGNRENCATCTSASPLRETTNNINLEFSPILSAKQRGMQQRSQATTSSARDSQISESEERETMNNCDISVSIVQRELFTNDPVTDRETQTHIDDTCRVPSVTTPTSSRMRRREPSTASRVQRRPICDAVALYTDRCDASTSHFSSFLRELLVSTTSTVGLTVSAVRV